MKDKLTKEYRFFKIFAKDAKQENIFFECKIPQLIEHVFNGFNSTIFVYGATGAGKTFTMEGANTRPSYSSENSNLGKVRLLNYLFEMKIGKLD